VNLEAVLVGRGLAGSGSDGRFDCKSQTHNGPVGSYAQACIRRTHARVTIKGAIRCFRGRLLLKSSTSTPVTSNSSTTRTISFMVTLMRRTRVTIPVKTGIQNPPLKPIVGQAFPTGTMQAAPHAGTHSRENGNPEPTPQANRRSGFSDRHNASRAVCGTHSRVNGNPEPTHQTDRTPVFLTPFLCQPRSSQV
jgi:hypothetical protein